MSARIRLTDLMARSCKPALREYALQDAVIRGLTLRVRAEGAKTWILRTRKGDRALRIALGDAKTMTVEMARQRAHAILSGSTPAAAITRPDAVTLKKFAVLYLDRRQKDWRPLTLRSQRTYLGSQLLPALGKLPLDRIGVPEVAEWFHTYSRTKPGGANRAIAVLSDLITRAIEWGALPPDHPNPCFAIRRNRSRSRGQMLNTEALSRLGAALEKYALIRTDGVDAIRLLLLTGARPGEICDLQWQEVEPGRILLKQAKRGPRSIPLGTSATRILNARRKRHGASRFVFPHRTRPEHAMPLPVWTWRKIKHEAQLPPNLRLHDLRHNFASHALLAGESLLVAGSMLGHSRPAMTARYAHLADDHLLDAAQRIAAEIKNMARPEPASDRARHTASPVLTSTAVSSDADPCCVKR
jgi:integrase